MKLGVAQSILAKLDSLSPLRVWVLFFVYSLLVALLIQLVLLPFVFPQWHGGNGLLAFGDWLGFHDEATALAELIQQKGWAYWVARPPPGEYLESGIAGAVYALIYPKPWAIAPLAAILHSLGGLILFLILQRATRISAGMAFLATLPFIVFPSSLIWVAQIHKDGAAILGTFLYLYGWLGLVRWSEAEIWRKRFRFSQLLPIVWMALGVLLAFYTRRYLCTVFQYIGYLFSLGLCIRVLLQWKNKLFQAKECFFSLCALILFPMPFIPLLKSWDRHLSSYPAQLTQFESMGGNIQLNVRYTEKRSGPPPVDPLIIAPPDRSLEDEAPVGHGTGMAQNNGEQTKPFKHLPIYSTNEIDTLSTEPALQPPTPGNREELVRSWGNLYGQDWWIETSWVPRFVESKFYSIAQFRMGFRGSGGASLIDRNVLFHSTVDVIRYLPRALSIVFWAPFPDQWAKRGSIGSNSTFRKVTGGEMLFVYLTFPFWLIAMWVWRSHVEYWMLQFLSISSVLALALAIPNMGTFHRLRYGYLLMWVGIGICAVPTVWRWCREWWNRQREMTQPVPLADGAT